MIIDQTSGERIMCRYAIVMINENSDRSEDSKK